VDEKYIRPGAIVILVLAIAAAWAIRSVDGRGGDHVVDRAGLARGDIRSANDPWRSKGGEQVVQSKPDTIVDERLDGEERFFVKGLLLFPIVGLMAICLRRIRLSKEHERSTYER
jgi:hypothetical protein